MSMTMTISLAFFEMQRHGARRMVMHAMAAVALVLTAPMGALAQNSVPNKAMASLPTPATAKAQRSQAQTQSQHEAQLSAIRQAILQATMDRPTRVLSNAWIDDKGALHESDHFQSDAQVRGVRVMAYLEDEKDAPMQVSADVLPWGWRTDKAASTRCSAPPRAWRLPLVVQTRTDAGFTGNQNFASQTLLNAVSQVWTQKMQSSQRWRVQVKETPYDNPYMRALTGTGDGISGWAAELVLKPHAPEVPFNLRKAWDGLGKDEADWRWTLSLTLGERRTPTGLLEPQWQVEQVLSIDPRRVNQQPSAWAQNLTDQIQQQMQAWVQQLDQRSACEPIQFHVRRTGQEMLQLQAGIESGLRAGDRVLLMNPSHIPSQMLEAGATQYLALAQVVKVGAQRTELQQVAGPALAAQGQWVAMPL